MGMGLDTAMLFSELLFPVTIYTQQKIAIIQVVYSCIFIVYTHYTRNMQNMQDAYLYILYILVYLLYNAYIQVLHILNISNFLLCIVIRKYIN